MADDLTAAVIAAYRPRMPDAAAVFARTVVTAVDPSSVPRAKALLWGCAKLATFGLGVGLEPDPAVLLHPSVIERFVLVGCAEVSGAARRTLRTNLRHVAARVGGGPPPVALSRERAKAPYTDADIAAYLGLADAQPTVARRMRAQALVCLGAGAGLTGADLRRVRGSDVVCRSGGVLVNVSGRRPRAVPVLARYGSRLLAAARFAGAGRVIGSRRINRPPLGRSGRATAPRGSSLKAVSLRGRPSKGERLLQDRAEFIAVWHCVRRGSVDRGDLGDGPRRSRYKAGLPC